MHPAVHIDKMRDQLITLDQAREELAVTEPLGEKLIVADSNVEFEIPDDWTSRDVGDDEPLEGAVIKVGGSGSSAGEYTLTRNSLLETGSACRITRGYQKAIPPDLLRVNLEWWFHHGHRTSDGDEKEFKLLTRESDNQPPTVAAFTRGAVIPFSNLHLLDAMLAGIEAKFGEGEVLVDYKFSHSVERTHMRLIIPGQRRTITNTSVADDTWSIGMQLKNSLIGLRQTILDGYLFRWWCTNGCIDTLSTSGGFSRRTAHTPEEVYEWARTSVDSVLGGLEGTLDGIQALTDIPVTDDATSVLRDLFAQYGLPVRERERVIAQMADATEPNMYGLLNAITVAANADDVPVSAVEQLMAMGGHAAHAVTGRCSADHPCRRLLPEGYTVPGGNSHA